MRHPSLVILGACCASVVLGRDSDAFMGGNIRFELAPPEAREVLAGASPFHLFASPMSPPSASPTRTRTSFRAEFYDLYLRINDDGTETWTADFGPPIPASDAARVSWPNLDAPGPGYRRLLMMEHTVIGPLHLMVPNQGIDGRR